MASTGPSRLDLRPVDPTRDLDELFGIFGAPAGADGRHRDRDTTRRWLERAAARWESDGLSYWTVRVDGEVIGVGGVQRQRTGDWNLFYRIAVAHRGRGYATELARAGCAAAVAHDPAASLVAWIAPQNVASRRVAERIAFVERGPAQDPSDGRIRLELRPGMPARDARPRAQRGAST